MPMIEIRSIGSKSCDLEIKPVLHYHDDAEVRTDRVSVRKNFLHDVRRRVGRDIEVLRRQSTHHVAHATAREVSDVSALAQTLCELARSFFHRRYAHGDIVAAPLYRGE